MARIHLNGEKYEDSPARGNCSTLIARKKPGADSVTWVDPKVLKRMAREAAAEAAAQEGEGNV